MIERSTQMRLMIEQDCGDEQVSSIACVKTNETIAKRASRALIESLLNDSSAQIDSIGEGDCVLVGCHDVRDSIAGFGGDSDSSTISMISDQRCCWRVGHRAAGNRSMNSSRYLMKKSKAEVLG